MVAVALEYYYRPPFGLFVCCWPSCLLERDVITTLAGTEWKGPHKGDGCRAYSGC